MNHAIELLTTEANNLQVRATLMTDPVEGGELIAKRDELVAAAEVLRIHHEATNNSVSPQAVIAKAKENAKRCQAFINIKDAPGGTIDMDIQFFPEVNNASPAHQTVLRFMESVDKAQLRPAAANDES